MTYTLQWRPYALLGLYIEAQALLWELENEVAVKKRSCFNAAPSFPLEESLSFSVNMLSKLPGGFCSSSMIQSFASCLAAVPVHGHVSSNPSCKALL